MAERRRGEATKERILEEACKVFSEKGYRDATHAEICLRAGTNAAAVNYYFASKDNLYRTVFDHLIQRVERSYPFDGGLSAESPPEDRLRAFIHAHLKRMFDSELMGDLHRIRMAEMFDPTGVLDEPLAHQLARDRDHIRRILGELLGASRTEQDVDWCEMSIVGQCFIGAPGPAGKTPRVMFHVDAADLDALTEHIVKFSLAGVDAVRRKGSNEMENEAKKIGNPQ